MQIFKRTEIFKRFEIIKIVTANFQKPFFDDENDSKDDEIFDALEFEKEIDSKKFSLRVPNKNIDKHHKILSFYIKKLFVYLNVEELIIISHLKIDFFGNLNHDYSKVINAYQKLSEYFPEKTFKEAINLKIDEIDNFIEIFFWLERCDPSIPEYVLWFDKNQDFCFFICKYGNIHFIDLTNGNLIKEKELEKIGFRLDDFDQFE